MKSLVTAALAAALLTAAFGGAGQAAADPAKVTVQPETPAAADVAGSTSVGVDLGLVLQFLIYSPSGESLTCGNGAWGVGGVPSTALCPLVMGSVQTLDNSGS